LLTEKRGRVQIFPFDRLTAGAFGKVAQDVACVTVFVALAVEGRV